MTPNHEAVPRMPLVEQARVMGENHGRTMRSGLTVHSGDFALAVLLSNAGSAAEHVAIRTAYDEAYAKACPPPRYVETYIEAVREVFVTGRGVVI